MTPAAFGTHRANFSRSEGRCPTLEDTTMELLDYTTTRNTAASGNDIPPAHALARLSPDTSAGVSTAAGFLRMPCPAHGSKSDSLSVWAGDNGLAARCFAGCGYSRTFWPPWSGKPAWYPTPARKPTVTALPDRRPQVAPAAEGPLSYAEVAALLGNDHLGAGQVRQNDYQRPPLPTRRRRGTAAASGARRRNVLWPAWDPASVGGRIRYRNRRRTGWPLHDRTARQTRLIRNPGLTGPGWQPRRDSTRTTWTPPPRLSLPRVKRTPAYSALAGFVSFTQCRVVPHAPQSADWSIVANAAHALGLPVVVMAGDNDDVPDRKARQAVVTAALHGLRLSGALALSLAASAMQERKPG